MLRFFFTTILLLIITYNNAQEHKIKFSIYDKELEKIVQVDTNPEPPMGMTNFISWINSNYNCPEPYLKQNRASLDSLVQISFLIDIDGRLKEYRVIRDPGYDTGITLVDLLRKIGKWKPAIYKGNPVPVRFTLPIKLPTTNRKP